MPNATCSADACDDKAAARGLCHKHYQRLAKTGLPPLPQGVRNADLQCSVADCANPVHSRKLCNGHYSRLRTFGDVKAEVPLQVKRRGRSVLCAVDGCGEPYSAKDLCKKHYMEARGQRLAQDPCPVTGCDRPRGPTSEYCVRHYQRLLKFGDPLAGGELRCLRGTGDPWASDEARRAAKAKMAQVSGETREYVKILRLDPCAYCGAASEHIDHIVPFKKDGPTHWTNLAPACASCNHRKSATDLLPFLLARVNAAA